MIGYTFVSGFNNSIFESWRIGKQMNGDIIAYA